MRLLEENSLVGQTDIRTYETQTYTKRLIVEPETETLIRLWLTRSISLEEWIWLIVNWQ